MNLKDHWNQIYASKSPTEVGWYQPHLSISMDLISRSKVAKDSRILDVGGGASTLADDFLQAGFEDVTVLDISGAAIARAKQRLGERAERVRWIEGNITQVSLPHLYYDLWHDRAVFHFLNSAAERTAYVAAAEQAIKAGGYLIVGTFALSGPPQCSGLDVVRYSPDSLESELGESFKLIQFAEESHVTPWGVAQDFVYCLFKKT